MSDFINQVSYYGYVIYPHRTHMQDLKDITQDVHYENFRKKKLLQGGGGWVYYRGEGLILQVTMVTVTEKMLMLEHQWLEVVVVSRQRWEGRTKRCVSVCVFMCVCVSVCLCVCMYVRVHVCPCHTVSHLFVFTSIAGWDQETDGLPTSAVTTTANGSEWYCLIRWSPGN